MKVLQELEAVWGSAQRQRELLIGLVDMADLTEADLAADTSGEQTIQFLDRGTKRSADTSDRPSIARSTSTERERRPAVPLRKRQASGANKSVSPPLATPTLMPPTLPSDSLTSTSFQFMPAPSPDPLATFQFSPAPVAPPPAPSNYTSAVYNELLASLLAPTASTSGTGMMNFNAASELSFGSQPGINVPMYPFADQDMGLQSPFAAWSSLPPLDTSPFSATNLSFQQQSPFITHQQAPAHTTDVSQCL